MPAYIVVDIEVTDPVRYQEYVRLASASSQAYGGRYLVRGGRTETLEGNWTPHRFVIVEFPDLARAHSWWSSPEYAPAKKIRQESAQTNMILAEGI